MNDITELATIIAAKLSERLERNFQIMPTLTLAQAAKALGVSDATMRKLCIDNKIPYIKIEKLYRIKPADINDYLDKKYHPSKN